MTKTLKTLIIIFGLFANNVYADILRPTTFDERPSCEKSKGMWRDFGNSCVGKCESKLDKFAVCSYAITFGCDCGANRCYYEDRCILISEYVKIHEQKMAEEQKISDEYKIKRQNALKKFQNNYINKLAGIFGQDPNYIHNYPKQPRPLAQNEFKNTNRLLIYNEIIKKKNERTAELTKKYDEELAKVKEDQEKSIAEKEELIKKINEEKSKLKVIAELKEVVPVEEEKDTVVSKKKTQKVTKDDDQGILADLIDNEAEQEIAPAIQQSEKTNNKKILPENKNATDQDKIYSQASNSIKEATTPQDYLQKINDVANNIAKNNLNGNNNSTNEIPPLYIKQQNGEQDFANRNIIDNTANVPQFQN